jgi:predicted site-specific integrase-resolvase
MKRITDISYDNRVNVQTLYQRIRVRDIPVVLDSEGNYCVEDEHIDELLRVAKQGRPRSIDK